MQNEINNLRSKLGMPKVKYVYSWLTTNGYLYDLSKTKFENATDYKPSNKMWYAVRPIIETVEVLAEISEAKKEYEITP